jgi:hypothetical protein
MHRQRALWLVALVLFVSASAYAQVTTATLVGLVRDNSGAVIPGASVVATNEGTGVAREGVSDANGEFVFAALPNGPYTVRIELTGFKTISQRGIELGAGQTVRQTFTLEVGAMSETVTVTGDAPLVQTAMSLQADSLGSQEVRELPVNRRNVQGLIGLTAGVVITGTGAAGGSGGVQMNGVASGGTGVTVDGTEANSNPEGRSLTQYGSGNQMSVMSLDAIAEVQIVKGVLPAEYGGVAGGQINVISRSGTNNFSGEAYEYFRNKQLNANTFFGNAGKQPRTPFNQMIVPINLPLSISQGDSLITQDLRTTRRIDLGESGRLLLIGEVFNLFNVSNLSGYSNVLNQMNYGQPSARAAQVFGSGGPRAFQVAARLEF